MGLLAPGIPISTRLALAIALSIGLPGCVPGATDHDDATSVHRFIRDRYPFPAANVPKLGPTIYFRPGISQTDLVVYAVTTNADQDRIIELARQARATGPKKPIHITFMDAERFVGAKEGEPGSRRRSGEKVLREVTVRE